MDPHADEAGEGAEDGGRAASPGTGLEGTATFSRFAWISCRPYAWRISVGSGTDASACECVVAIAGPMWRLGLDGGGGGEAARLPERPGEADCGYYLRTGGCGFGERCRYNHPRDRGGTEVSD
jgi:hypothetical protein